MQPLVCAIVALSSASLAIARIPAGGVARYDTVEVKVPRQQLGKATGEIGLFAENDGKDPVTIELRAFQPGQ